jgi:uncharacterized protein (TIGR02271 family)
MPEENEYDQLGAWIGHTLVDRDGDKIGEIVDIYADEATGRPEWIAVDTGRFGHDVSFVPLAGAAARGDELQVGYSTQQVVESPNAEADGQLSQEEEARLYSHYDMDYDQGWSDTGVGRGARMPGGDADSYASTGRAGTSRDRDRDRDVGDDAMTRSEEELRVGTETREAGRARLRKYVVTEQETRTVPVSREEVRLEREPITDTNVGDALDGPDIAESEHEVVLHEERPVIEKETVPKERVRLDTETVTEDRQVTEDVRKERIDADDVDRR